MLMPAAAAGLWNANVLRFKPRPDNIVLEKNEMEHLMV